MQNDRKVKHSDTGSRKSPAAWWPLFRGAGGFYRSSENHLLGLGRGRPPPPLLLLEKRANGVSRPLHNDCRDKHPVAVQRGAVAQALRNKVRSSKEECIYSTKAQNIKVSISVSISAEAQHAFVEALLLALSALVLHVLHPEAYSAPMKPLILFSILGAALGVQSFIPQRPI